LFILSLLVTWALLRGMVVWLLLRWLLVRTWLGLAVLVWVCAVVSVLQ
jgi:hypothetical protein